MAFRFKFFVQKIIHMNTKSILFLFIFCLVSIISKAGFEPVVVTGYNNDIVANGVGAATGSITVNADGGSPGFAFVAPDFQAIAGNPAPTYSLPAGGLINNVNTPGNNFQLASYSGNNALRLATTASGTLQFGTPKYASDVYLLAASGTGVSTATITITFADATTQVFTGLSVSDWYDAAGFAIQGIGRVRLSDNVLEGSTTNPRLYEMKLSLSSANYNKQIISVTVAKTNTTGGLTIVVMGVSINSLSPCVAPTAQPSALVLSPTLYNVGGSFNAAAPPADKYLVLRTPGATTPTIAPANGTVYTAGGTVGNATVISAAAATTFNDGTVTGNTTYRYTVYSYNDALCYNPAYNLTAPLSATTTTPACAPIAAGTYSVGAGGTYPTITAAINAIYSGGGATGNVILELRSSYSSGGETFPITIPNLSTTPCAVGTPTITVRPTVGATNLSIINDNPTAIIDFNASRNFIFDGRPGGVGTAKHLAISNLNTTGVTVRFINEATSNSVMYCDVQGQNTSSTSTALSGVIYFAGTTGANGNDNNTIANCDIHGTGSGDPAIGIAAYGATTTTSTYNDNNTISNCNVYDYFIASASSTGIKIDAGNTAWTITGNSFYLTNPRTYTSTATQRALWVTPNVAAITTAANNFTISNNFIGGSAPSATGSVYGVNGSVAFSFIGMDLSLGGGTASSIQGNTIANISVTSTSTSTTGVFVGIGTANGVMDIGTVTGNTIGSTTTNSSITVYNGLSGTSFGIRLGGGTTINVANNKIAGIDVNGSGAAISVNFIGIGTSTASGGATTTSITGNTIGSLIMPNSINLPNPSTSTTAQTVAGINISSGVTTSTISNNIIANLNNNHAAGGTTSFTRGIAVTTSASSITGNVIRNLSNSTLATGGGATSGVSGIVMSSTNVAGCNVTGNIIDSLVLTSGSSTAASNMTGIFYSGTSSAVSTISKNFIHSFDISNANTNVTMTGIDFATATANLVNNMIRLGIKPDGSDLMTAVVVRGISSNSSSATNNILHNSIYIGGANVDPTAKNSYAFIRTSASGTYSISNNIFVNARSNASAGSGGKHYALYFTTGTTGATTNYNLYYAPGTDGYIGYTGTADVQAYSSAWIAGDNNSITANPQFVAPTGNALQVNLHIKTNVPTAIEGAGLAFAVVTDDFDGDTRASLTPTDIGADAGNFIANDISAPVIVYTPFDYTCATTDRSFSATITDATGVPLTGTLIPRVYFQKNSGTWYSSAGTLASGTANNSVWNFNITMATMGGVSAGDVVNYYVIAQDVATTPNVGSSPGAGLVATNVNTVSTAPSAPRSYNVASGPLPGSITVTPSAASVCKTTASPVLLKATGGQIAGSFAWGTQTAQNTSTTYPAPFSNYFGGTKHQILVLASELSSAGFAAGIPLTSLNLNVVSLGTTFTSCQNFKVKVGHTTSTALTTTFATGLTEVFGPVTVNPTPGYNNLLTFTTPFNWNGTDNLIIETSYSNANTGASTDAVIMYNTTTTFVSTSVYRADGVTPAAVEAAATATTTYSTRPDFTLTGLLAAPFTWSPTTGLYTNAAGTTAYTGTTRDSVWAWPTTTTTYTVKATTANSCSVSKTIAVTDTCGIVPVTLLSFKGERTTAGNKLEWTTATEINNAGFELERSANGRAFSKLTFVASKASGGNSTLQFTYVFTDAKAQLTTNSYYRLKQIDKDGKATYSNVVLIHGDKVNAIELTGLYPNPAKANVNVLLASPKMSEVTLVVTDVTGKIIMQKTDKVQAGSNNLNLDVRALTNGQYFLKIICADGCETNIGKFMKL
jgi:hypothetical protein